MNVCIERFCQLHLSLYFYFELNSHTFLSLLNLRKMKVSEYSRTITFSIYKKDPTLLSKFELLISSILHTIYLASINNSFPNIMLTIGNDQT